jgi:hypothetical protein
MQSNYVDNCTLSQRTFAMVVMTRIHQNSVMKRYHRMKKEKEKEGLDDRGEPKGTILNLNQSL